jgi:hypothetical protein
MIKDRIMLDNGFTYEMANTYPVLFFVFAGLKVSLLLFLIIEMLRDFKELDAIEKWLILRSQKTQKPADNEAGD